MLPPKDFSFKDALKRAGGYNTAAMYELGKAYFWAWDTEIDYIKAFEIWQGAGAWHEEIGGIHSEEDIKIAEYEVFNGKPRYMLFLAEIYFHGLRVKENINVALDWWNCAAHKGEADAMYRLGWYYWHQKNIKLGKKWLQKAARLGHFGAIEDLKKIEMVKS